MEVTVENGVAVDVRGADDAVHRRHALHQGREIPRPHLLEGPRAPPAAARRREGPGQGGFARISWDEALDEIAARFKAVAAEDPQQILPCSYAGTMGMLQYMSMDRRFFHRLGASLLDRTLCSSAGKVGMQGDARRFGGHGPRAFRRSEADPHLGLEPGRLEPSPLVALPGSEAPRREVGRDRSVAQPDRREVPPAHPAAAGHRRRARARDDARHHRRGPLRPRLRRTPHAGLRGAEGARQAVPAGEGRAHLRHRSGRRSSISRASTRRCGRQRSG